jgi:hypothetical protein
VTSRAPWPLAARAVFVPGAVVVLLLFACGLREDLVTVARVGGEPVVFADFEAFVRSQVGDDWMGVDEEVLQQLFRQFLDEHLLARLARDEGLADSEADRMAALDALRRRLVAEPVGDAEIRRYLDAHPEALRRPERLVLGQLLLPDRALAEEAWQKMQGGADFAAVAEEMSERPGVVYGGYTENVSRQDLPPAFRDVLFALAPGEVSGVLEADYGYHIFQVREHRPEEVLAPSAAASWAAGLLEREHADLLIGDMLAKARARYPIEVLDWNLPFQWDVGDSSGDQKSAPVDA